MPNRPRPHDDRSRANAALCASALSRLLCSLAALALLWLTTLWAMS